MIKRIFLRSVLIIPFITGNLFAQTPCNNGNAAGYPCNGFDFMSNIPVSTLSNGNPNSNGAAPAGSDIWGWTDPLTQKEYALAATSNSTAFVDISDPVNPIFLGRLNSNAGNNSWRDVKVYNNYAFIVADGVGSHGVQIFNLTRLRNVTTPQNFTADRIYSGVGSCHNIIINEDTGIAYLLGCRNDNGGGPIFLDISNPMNPINLGNYRSAGYSHDAVVVTYHGPDTAYTNREIYIGSNENQIVVLDVTNKSNVQRLATINYSLTGYTHQGWFTEDHRYFILGDELDERNYGVNTRSLIFDLQDLNNPRQSSTYYGSTRAIDHNGYVKGNEFYIASYTAGLRVLDISNIGASSNAMNEIGYFDTYPQNNNTSFNGAWSVYPYFNSGNIVINDIQRGLFVVRKSGTLSIDESTLKTNLFTIGPNPSSSNPTIKSYNKPIENIEVYNILGKRVYDEQSINNTEFILPIETMAKGVYFVRINNLITKKLIHK